MKTFLKKSILLFTIGVAILTSNKMLAQWVQKGIDLDGEYAGDQSGTSVDMSDDGSTIIIGAIGNDANGNAGHARVYNWSGTAWIQLGQDIDGENPNDWCGQAVAISADGLTVAVGAHRNAGNGANSGHVRVFKLISGSWVQQGADIDGEAANDYSGTSVDLSSDGLTVVIGARGNDGNGSNSGHARVFKLITGVWVQQGADIDGEAAEDNSGIVSISDDGLTVAIGAYLNDGNGTNSGHVRVYKLIAGTWTQQGADIDGEGAGDNSGKSVSLTPDGLTLAIGAPENIGGPITFTGHARVYKYVAGNWVQQGGDIDGEASSDDFGESVSISSDGLTVAVGGFRNDGVIPGVDIGHVRVYKLIAGTWTQQGADIDGEAASDWFGKAVSISSSGTSVLIGAVFNDGNGLDSGHSRVYSNCVNTNGTDVQAACGSYTWPLNSTTYTSSTNTPTHTIVGGNYNGCDSIVTLNLTINNATNGTDVQVACGSYTWPLNSTTYTSSTATPSHTIVGGNANGCDSVVTLNLTINTVDNTTSTQGVDSISANASGASYQWLDCDNNYAVINGETSQLFVATSNGNFAVEVTQNGCTDTSACVNITGVGINELFKQDLITVYPNPTNGLLTILYNSNSSTKADLKVTDITGKITGQWKVTPYDKLILDLSNEPKGIYFLEFRTASGKQVKKLLLQ